MFKLNQPIIKNKVLTWSRDLTILHLCNNLATAILPTSKETEIQKPGRVAILIPEDENECRSITYLPIRTERANPEIRSTGALLAALKHVSSVTERAAWHLEILLESERLHASSWREFLPGNESVEKRRQPLPEIGVHVLVRRTELVDAETQLLDIRCPGCSRMTEEMESDEHPCHPMDGIHVNSRLNPCHPAGYCFTFTSIPPNNRPADSAWHPCRLR